MTDLVFIKSDMGIYPGDKPTEEYVLKMGYGTQIHADFKKRRNVKFHRKAFLLLNFLYENWSPPENEYADSRFGTPEKNFERFRRDVTILAGFFYQTVRLNGEVRTEAKSISFSNMDEDEFADYYSKVIDVGLKYVLKNYTKDDIDSVVNELLGFV